MFDEMTALLAHYMELPLPCRLEVATPDGEKLHFHDEWELKFFPEHLLVIAPGVIHAAGIGHRGVLSISHDGFLIGWCGTPYFPTHPFPPGLPLPELLDFFARHATNCCPELRQQFSGLLVTALQKLLLSLPGEHPPRREAASALREYFERNYFRSDLSIADAAAALGFSQQYLSRQCQKKWQCPPRKLLTDIRLAHAAKLLRSGSFLVADAARLTGWSSPFYFSNIFRKNYGIPPGEFSRQENSK